MYLTGRGAGLGWVILSTPCNSPFQKHQEFVASPLMAESLALREAVQSCVEKELKEVCFESDSAQLIKSIASGNGLSEIYGVAFDILSSAALFKSASFNWIPRERNILADNLAKDASFVGETRVVELTFMVPN
ncbi:hypothetical protein IGI04_004949 [Brassica rapa subsp. trilocularis]|uniref:RNase H type-1 domain-containing protein n=1 Tax=Brassica rapa subsp. trilocularis TaxID=1813537 RepID=A0ABQ7NCL8_BRACM|nr:hypothetical protein IGI04_004949 [Brassica rapa subsp. trilocularis]